MKFFLGGVAVGIVYSLYLSKDIVNGIVEKEVSEVKKSN